MINIILVTLITTVLYFIIYVVKTKYINKEKLEFKHIVMNSFIVSISSYVAFYIVINYNLGNDNILKEVKEIPAFTGGPDF
jgi:hypothetical protein